MEAPILIVEDDDDSRIMLATVLTLHGYRVLTASNGAEALFLAREHRPCVILLDLMMPVMDGEEFRARQLADTTTEDIPVIIVSARHGAQEKARQLGAVSCVSKPIDIQQLSAQIACHCAHAAART